MKFEFENVGFIDEGCVELADLTLICGPNNVGKTYISYSIYGFLKHFKTLADFSLNEKQIAKLQEEGSLSIDLAAYQKQLTPIIKTSSIQYSRTLANYFNAPTDLFTKAKVDFLADDFTFELSAEFKQSAKFGRSETLIFDKAPNESILSIAFQLSGENKLPTRILNDVVSDVIADCLLANILPQPFVVTSERTGISLFYKELDASKNAIIDQLADSDKYDPSVILNHIRSRYAKPIQDNIDVIRNYQELSKQHSFIRQQKEQYQPVLDALQDLLGGRFKAVDQQVVYEPEKEQNRKRLDIPVYIASSSIKSLFLIDLYINCLAEKQGLLIIDEPELNLHPDNQRKMAALLARLVNAGIKVMITTHSDYLIREINNRIMLANDFPTKQAVMNKAKITATDILQPSQVSAFSLKEDHTIKAVAIDKYGVNMEIFDNLIADANTLADDIYYGIGD